jgi:prepilin-type N-terminal cleavage/methylation domain-containing protein
MGAFVQRSGPSTAAAPVCAARTPSLCRAFSLIELVIVVVIVAIIGAIAMGRYGDFARNAQIAASQRVARDLQTCVDDYYLTYGAYPTRLDSSVYGDRPIRHPMATEYRYQIQLFDAATGPDRENPVNKRFDSTPGSGLRPIWYNPAVGSVRLRVPATWPTDGQLSTYNTINGTRLRSMVEVAPGVVPTTPPVAAAAEIGL